MFRNILVLLVMGVFITGIGCSADSSSPLTPGGPIHEMSYQPSDGARCSHVMPWGFYNISIDSSTWEVQIEPVRVAVYTVDVVKFLQPPAGKLINLKIKVTDLSLVANPRYRWNGN